MSDNPVDYSGMFGNTGEVAPPEPAEVEIPESEPTLADIPAEPVVEPEVEESVVDPETEEKIEDIIETAVDATVDAIEEMVAVKYVKANVDDVGKLNIRESPDGAIVTRVTPKTLLKVVDDSDPEWTKVEFEDGSSVTVGYAKNLFLVEA